jgi:hypothetical protein
VYMRTNIIMQRIFNAMFANKSSCVFYSLLRTCTIRATKHEGTQEVCKLDATVMTVCCQSHYV